MWFILALLSGAINGSFPVPMKAVRTWKWEHIWSAWSLWALIVLPWLAGWITVPNLWEVYQTTPGHAVLMTFLVGGVWGIGAITFGMGVDYLGVGLGLAIIMGLNTALGVMIPLLLSGKDAFISKSGGLILLGVVIMLAGLVICGRAGKAKEELRLKSSNAHTETQNKPFFTGLVICIIAGVCGALINIGFVMGEAIQKNAEALGVSSLWAPNAVWCVLLSGAFIVNTGYCFYRVHAGQAWKMYAASLPWNVLLSFIMGLLWFGGVLLYGVSSSMLGRLGTSVGFAAFLGMGITAGNLWGILTGEWAGEGKKQLPTMLYGVGFLLLGLIVIGYANSLQA